MLITAVMPNWFCNIVEARQNLDIAVAKAKDPQCIVLPDDFVAMQKMQKDLDSFEARVLETYMVDKFNP